ncbi:YrrS family protein [Aquisalibacillus elongatus]|uniref:Uncharacterized protein DUF1510 n=1 Tax=Aquisalibacillus elongatus TaxID=485577 RepID=A0A3N5C0G2_9BACI|nr:YrrS family protein [Aquisalibacillus elongatus]RPF55548.1 uncharacterized protein DUF1510 [Aquisalibacillus elongatus]
MAYDSIGTTRSDRYESRRKNTKLMNLLIIIAILLTAFLIGMLVFGDDEDEDNQDQAQESQTDESNDSEDQSEQGTNDNEDEDNTDQTETDNTDEDEEEQSSNNEDENETTDDETEQNEPAENSAEVKEVISGSWDPYPTEQEEPHTINWDTESQDFYEMKMAIASSLDVSSEDLIYWYVENGGAPDKVNGYVEQRGTNEYYRVYLEWIESEGWQPQRVEELYENIGEQKLEGTYENNDE